uniref:E3 ubiquitin-protein ligase HECTD1-like n=1 Tax=Myxine glutinosa TaxID=7769 RepID=UPI00358F4BE9
MALIDFDVVISDACIQLCYVLCCAIRFRNKPLILKVRRMARKLHEGRFEAVESIPRGILLALRNIATRLKCAWELHTSWKGRSGDNSWIKLMKAALEDLTVLLKEEKTICPHEMSFGKDSLLKIHFKAAFKTDGDGGRLTFQYYPSSKVYGFSAVDLKPNGEDEMVTVENAEEYVDLMLDFCLHSGITKQMEAFRDGFNQVFPMEKLIPFTPEEVQLKLCGDQCPSWTAEDINNYTEPMHGYTRESPAFLRFVNVLCKMDPHERKAFLQFTTGCSSLPLGGLSNLQPRLTIYEKVDASDGSFPSVNTCFHSLCLPDYSSEDIMRERLLAATMEENFHLN